MLSEVILSLPFIFFSAVLIGALMYATGSVIAPKGDKTADKLAPYACGEDMPGMKFQVNLERFFLYLTYFMVLDISAFMLALSFVQRGLYPILFSAIIAFSLLSAIPMIRSGKK
ncbi:MAG: NADH-quinone oxidoreductase subunit A [Candidatus Bathyarchaeota archaeon]|nr:NADH-quinone oxidoreductase subunit A [Candidatus Bathyarchaeota archaeon]